MKKLEEDNKPDDFISKRHETELLMTVVAYVLYLKWGIDHENNGG